MSTRAVIHLQTTSPAGTRGVVTIYKHFDGYPDGLGQTLQEFAEARTLVNGITLRRPRTIQSNGAGCLFAQLVVHLKKYDMRPGDVYLQPYDTDVDMGQDFTYVVEVRETFDGAPSTIQVSCSGYAGPVPLQSS